MVSPVPQNETERLRFLDDLRLNLALPYEEIQGLCEVAAVLAGSPIALVTLIGETQQKFLAKVGVGDMTGTDREIAFCAHAIMESQQLEVPDARKDARFKENPLVVNEPHIRAYLGTVLEPADEMRVGTLCVLDTEPQVYSEEVKDALAQIGDAVSALLTAHRKNLELIDFSEEIANQNDKLVEMTAALQTSMDSLLVAEKAKSEFTATITHELRTPLTSIKGALSLLKHPDVEANRDKSKRLVKVAYENSERLLALVNDILLLQRESFDAHAVVFTDIDLAELINTSAEAYQSYAGDMNVSLTVSGTDSPCVVHGNAKLLDRVMANLLSNAFKFSTPPGKIEVHLQTRNSRPQILVKDDGSGIPEGSEDKVFGLFSQVDNSDVRSHKGSGLGMHICKKILEQHNATISYESTLGVGTTFTVNFPRRSLRRAVNYKAWAEK